MLDSCGVCKGDGTSCVIPTSTELVCKQQNIFDTLISLDGSGHDLANLSNSILRQVVNKGGNKKAAKKNKAASEVLKQQAWNNTWAIPSIIKSDCTGGTKVVCTTVSNESLKSTYVATVTELYNLNQSLLKQLSKLKGKKKAVARLQKLNDQALATALSTAGTVPAGTVSCS